MKELEQWIWIDDSGQHWICTRIPGMEVVRRPIFGKGSMFRYSGNTDKDGLPVTGSCLRCAALIHEPGARLCPTCRHEATKSED